MFQQQKHVPITLNRNAKQIESRFIHFVVNPDFFFSSFFFFYFLNVSSWHVTSVHSSNTTETDVRPFIFFGILKSTFFHLSLFFHKLKAKQTTSNCVKWNESTLCSLPFDNDEYSTHFKLTLNQSNQNYEMNAKRDGKKLLQKNIKLLFKKNCKTVIKLCSLQLKRWKCMMRKQEQKTTA